MPNHIPVNSDGEQVKVPVGRRNPQGSNTEAVSASIPEELAQKINGIVVETKKSRSRVISELIADGFALRERKAK